MGPLFTGFGFLLVFQAVAGAEQSATVNRQTASDFLGSAIRTKRGLHEECYSESCVFEEVKEKLGKNERGYEYYYTYTCNKFEKNCKVRCEGRKDCSFGEWSGWIGKLPEELHPNYLGQCVKQRRYREYKHGMQVTYRRWNCLGLHLSCPRQSSETRQYCHCRSVICQLNGWSVWSGFVGEGNCGTQTRTRSYSSSSTSVYQVRNCLDVRSTCPRAILDVRKQCTCRKAECVEEAWTEWSGNGTDGSCYEETRKKPYKMKFIQEVLQLDTCPELPKSCAASKVEKRLKCSCPYVECKLENWSDWEPKQLEHGKCNQRQTRRKAYSHKTVYQHHLAECPSLPQKCPADIVETKESCVCSYRDSCDLGEWSDWSSPVTEEGCRSQTRHKKYKSALKHVERDNCDGLLTECVVEPMESRTMCKCMHVECKEEDWSHWVGPTLLTNNCVVQSRYKTHTAAVKYANRENDCNGLVTSCPADKKEDRTMCKCATLKCSTGEWGEWLGDLPIDGCTIQTRLKPVTSVRDTMMQENDCKDVQLSCPDPPTETRKQCNCSYREDCTVKNWGDWSGQIPQVGCVIQVRKRAYNNSLIYVQRDSCDALDSCPKIRDEVRTKCNCNEVQCRWTEWLKESFDAETNCVIEARMKNISNGFVTVLREDNCNGVKTSCRANATIERKKDCQSGGGGHVIITEKPAPTFPPTPVPTTGYVAAPHVYVGCYNDLQEHPRPIPLMLANLRAGIDWYHPEKTVQACADIATKARYKYFAIQFYAECWSGPDSENTYSRDGFSEDGCWSGLGKPSMNAVYRLQDMPACSGELKYETTVSSGEVSELAWCSSEKEDHWLKIDFGGEIKRVIGIGTQGVRKDSWITLYNIEFSEEGEEFTPYKEKGVAKMFAGNTDRFTLELHWLEFPIEARQVMIRPRAWTSTHYCMKVRIYGCAV